MQQLVLVPRLFSTSYVDFGLTYLRMRQMSFVGLAHGYIVKVVVHLVILQTQSMVTVHV